MKWAKIFFHLILLLDHVSLKIIKRAKENIKDEIKGITKRNVNTALTLMLWGMWTLIHRFMALPSASQSQPAISLNSVFAAHGLLNTSPEA